MTDIYRNLLKDKTPEELSAIMRRVLGPVRRELQETERKAIWEKLQFMEPVQVSNNQHSITEVYRMSDKLYHVHYGIYDYPAIDELENDDKY